MCNEIFCICSLFYPKIAHEVLPIRAIFIVGCGCAVKNPGPAMLVYPKIAHEILPIQAIFIIRCGCNLNNFAPAMLVYPDAPVGFGC